MLGNRDEIRFANLALISGRQMSIRASTMSIFLVAMTKTAADTVIFRTYGSSHYVIIYQLFLKFVTVQHAPFAHLFDYGRLVTKIQRVLLHRAAADTQRRTSVRRIPASRPCIPTAFPHLFRHTSNHRCS